jgi:hypothetical protein
MQQMKRLKELKLTLQGLQIGTRGRGGPISVLPARVKKEIDDCPLKIDDLASILVNYYIFLTMPS